MMLPLAFLLIAGIPLVETNVTKAPQRWTFNVQCYYCEVKNTFNCNNKKTCEYEVRRCMTVSIQKPSDYRFLIVPSAITLQIPC
ncbi:Glycosyl-phosphatidylinositol-anchored molecule-like protein [Fukomys damarensis]|uniref:Glycosyl-phosphatidylinositol-anchored molecule-like protein n=1 Tax=Fukomys damarensis TaxID=885580 RepID=A0A091D3Y3_FUKDA|nr:Glycosyl-phosphatidylinositol-anchored molecule-like protein [Fukomys damarensis]